MDNVQENTSSVAPVALSVDEAADAILSRWEEKDAETQPSEDPETIENPDVEQEETADIEDPDEAEETDSPDKDETEQDDEDAEETDDNDEADDEEAKGVSDDTQIEVTVNGKTQLYSVASLKRLAGQEAAITQKSQNVASQRKVLEDAIGKNHVAYQKMLEAAQERFKPYSEIDMLVAAKAMETEDFAALRKEAEAAQKDLKFLNEEADAFYKDVQEQQKAHLQKAAEECVKVLQDDIPDWNNQLYNDIRNYAIDQGLDEAEVNNYVDPSVLKILHKARLYDEGKKVATVKKKASTAKKVLRNSKAPEGDKQRKSQKMADAKAKLATSGNDLDDIANALLSRWEA
tara:strand:+ start:1694 stop:2731 length:1038 start_codon:yes stop_codon:yes gene_type:complete